VTTVFVSDFDDFMWVQIVMFIAVVVEALYILSTYNANNGFLKNIFCMDGWLISGAY
jgi:hypothetical protein